MKLFGITFGGNGPDDQRAYNPQDARLVGAEQYIESQWTSGLTRHYHAQGVVDSVQSRTGISISEQEAVGLVERVRLRHGWPARSHVSYFPPPDEE